MLSTTFTMGEVVAIYHFVVIDSTGTTLGRCETVEMFGFRFAQIDCALGRIYRSSSGWFCYWVLYFILLCLHHRISLGVFDLKLFSIIWKWWFDDVLLLFAFDLLLSSLTFLKHTVRGVFLFLLFRLKLVFCLIVFSFLLFFTFFSRLLAWFYIYFSI